jgi:hypothetical protein
VEVVRPPPLLLLLFSEFSEAASVDEFATAFLSFFFKVKSFRAKKKPVLYYKIRKFYYIISAHPPEAPPTKKQP